MPNLRIERQYRSPDGSWSEWVPSYHFHDNITALNDLFYILSTHYQRAFSPDELTIVAHRWRIFDVTANSTVEVSEESNMIQYDAYSSCDNTGEGAMPSVYTDDCINIEEHRRIFEELCDKGLVRFDEDLDEEDEDE